LTVMALCRHRESIGRRLSGTERRSYVFKRGSKKQE